jgi:microcystin-dependent protein
VSTTPQGWQTPKTNWDSKDPVGVSDLNRMEGNPLAIETGDRTLDPAQAPSSNTGTLRQILSWFANRILAILGTTNWWDAPPVTLKVINNKFDADNGHKHTGAAGDGPKIIPPGVIVMWGGLVANIPTGWALCNGANGTPDLRDRFIVGAGSKYAVGNKGGADSVTLTVNQIPAHTHTIGSFQKMDWGTHNNTDQLTPGTSSKSASTGGGQAHENRPPYYALCFIMKL